MTPMEADLLKMEMDQTLKQAEDALKEVRKGAAQEKRVWVVELAPQTAELFARCAALWKTRHTSGKSWTPSGTRIYGRSLS